jgi:hypothetical protein
MTPLFLVFMLQGAPPVAIASSTTVVRQSGTTTTTTPPPVFVALDAALQHCLTPRELALAAQGKTTATHRIVLRVERESTAEEVQTETPPAGPAQFREVSGLRYCGIEALKALTLAAADTLVGAELEHVVTFTVDRGFAEARLKSLDADFRRICRPNGTIDESVLKRVASLPGTTSTGKLGEIVGVPAQFALMPGCGGAESLRDLKSFARQDEGHLEAIVDHVDVLNGFDLGACGASFARLRWQSRDGDISAVVIDHQPRTEEVERCLAERAFGLDLGPKAPKADWDVVVDHGVDKETELVVRVRGATTESHAALRVRFAPLRAALASCPAFDDNGPLGRVTAVITRYKVSVRGPQVGIESCVREAADALKSALPDAAQFEVTFAVDDAVRAERTAFLAPHRAFLVRVCQAAEGAPAGRIAALFREVKDADLDPTSASLVRGFALVHPKDGLGFVETAAGEAGVSCPALRKGPWSRPAPPQAEPSLQERSCAAYVAAAGQGARMVATLEETHLARFDTYAPVATLQQTSAMPAHFRVTTPHVGTSKFLASLEGTGPFAGEVWEVDEASRPRRVKARPGACAKTPVR